MTYGPPRRKTKQTGMLRKQVTRPALAASTRHASVNSAEANEQVLTSLVTNALNYTDQIIYDIIKT